VNDVLDHCTQVSCAAISEDETFDLSSLALVDHSHSVLVSPSIIDTATRSATFYINICRPVARQDNVNCPVHASVCRKDADNTFVVSSHDAVDYLNENYTNRFCVSQFKQTDQLFMFSKILSEDS